MPFYCAEHRPGGSTVLSEVNSLYVYQVPIHFVIDGYGSVKEFVQGGNASWDGGLPICTGKVTTHYQNENISAGWLNPSKPMVATFYFPHGYQLIEHDIRAVFGQRHRIQVDRMCFPILSDVRVKFVDFGLDQIDLTQLPTGASPLSRIRDHQQEGELRHDILYISPRYQAAMSQSNRGTRDQEGNKSYCYHTMEWLDFEDFSNENFIKELPISDSAYDEHYQCCAECEDVQQRDEMHEAESGSVFCENCYADLYTQCSGCNCEIRIDSPDHQLDERDDPYCQNCRDNGHGNWPGDYDEDDEDSEPDRDSRLRGYSDRISTEVVLTAKSNIGCFDMVAQDVRFGFELETNYDLDYESEIFDVAKKYMHNKHIWKSDGSIGTGAELVSRPFTLNSFREIDFKNFFKELTAASCDSYTSGKCGLHVHVDRELIRGAMLKTSRLKSSYLVDRCCNLLALAYFQAYGEFFRRYSDRDTFHYCQTHTAQEPFYFRDGLAERRMGLNIQGDNTLEFRIFRGTLDHAKFRSDIALSIAFYEYLVHVIESGHLTMMTGKIRFFDWLLSNPKYQHLSTYICGKIRVEKLLDIQSKATAFIRRALKTDFSGWDTKVAEVFSGVVIKQSILEERALKKSQDEVLFLQSQLEPSHLLDIN